MKVDRLKRTPVVDGHLLGEDTLTGQSDVPVVVVQSSRVWTTKDFGEHEAARKSLIVGAEQPIQVERETVIGSLRSLRDNRVPAWRRLQAARSLEFYQSLVLKSDAVDFFPIKAKLDEISRRERVFGHATADDSVHVPGEGNSGKLNEAEPNIIRRLRERMRVLNHPRSMEKAYVGCVKRFIRQRPTLPSTQSPASSATSKSIGSRPSSTAEYSRGSMLGRI